MIRHILESYIYYQGQLQGRSDAHHGFDGRDRCEKLVADVYQYL